MLEDGSGGGGAEDDGDDSAGAPAAWASEDERARGACLRRTASAAREAPGGQCRWVLPSQRGWVPEEVGDEFLTVAEASKLLKVSGATVCRLVGEGKVKSIRVSHAIRILREGVDAGMLMNLKP